MLNREILRGHMPTTHPMVCPVPGSRVRAGNAILASQDSEITGWAPRVWTHGPRLSHFPVSAPLSFCCRLLRNLLNLFITFFFFFSFLRIDVLPTDCPFLSEYKDKRWKVNSEMMSDTSTKHLCGNLDIKCDQVPKWRAIFLIIAN